MVDRRGARRVVRHIDPWTVLRFSAVFYGSMALVGLVAGILLWVVAASTGVIDNVERFVTELFALESFRLGGGNVLRTGLVGALVMIVVGTASTVVLAVFYNLTADVVGGIEVTVADDEVPPAEAPPPPHPDAVPSGRAARGL